jgi:hypothetical protein
MSNRKRIAAPRRLADELIDGMEEICRWAKGEKTGVRVRVIEVPPKPIRPTRIKLPGGGMVTVDLTAEQHDPLECRRKVACIRRAVLKALAADGRP